VRGVAVGALVGVASWFVLTVGATAKISFRGTSFKVLIGAVVAMTIYRVLDLPGDHPGACFIFWKVGNGNSVGVLLYLTIGANLMERLGAMLGSSVGSVNEGGEYLPPEPGTNRRRSATDGGK